MDLSSGIPFTITISFLILVVSFSALILYGYSKVLVLRNDRYVKIKVVGAAVTLTGWLLFVSYLSTLHFLDQFSELPPRMAVVVLPPMILLIMAVNNKETDRLLELVKPQWLIFIQSYRFFISILFYMLFLNHIIPVHMTFAGKNFDILIGITAPIIGFLCLRKKLPNWLLTTWHLGGIVMLFNLVITAVLSAPFPFKLFHEQETNTMIAHFPFVLMPGFLIPAGIALHVFGLKQSLKELIKQSKKLNDKRLRYAGVSIAAVVIAFIMYMEFHAFSPDFVFGFLFAFGFTLLLWYGDRLIITKIRGMYPEYHQTFRRVVFQLLVIAIFTITTVLLIDSFLYVYVFHRMPSAGILLTDAAIGKIISCIMLIIYESIYFFSSWKQNIREVEHLKSLQVQNKLDILKNRLNPHFLFNSLSSLTSLIENDEKTAVDFVQKLSDVYRYILQSNESEFNSLHLELDFIEKYFYLLKIRFSKSLNYEIDIDESHFNKRIPQLSLQLLIDNAIKHNIISASKPLMIRLTTEHNGRLGVTNNMQPKDQVLKTGNFSLQDLSRRYQVMGVDGILVEQSSEMFKVSLALVAHAN